MHNPNVLVSNNQSQYRKEQGEIETDRWIYREKDEADFESEEGGGGAEKEEVEEE